MKRVITVFILALCSVSAWSQQAIDEDYEYVDLGLPSGTLWATCNVGAASPEAYGYYYAWGEKQPKEEYTWKNYKFRVKGDNGANVVFSKYNIQDRHGNIDNKTVLDLSDDVAHVIWGSAWRMPTPEEMIELEENCTWTWVKQKGKQGYKVTGKNGKSIFLPAAGAQLGKRLKDGGIKGAYWTSAFYLGDLPYQLVFQEGMPQGGGLTPYPERCIGLPIRPVYGRSDVKLADKGKKDDSAKQVTDEEMQNVVNLLLLGALAQQVTKQADDMASSGGAASSGGTKSKPAATAKPSGGAASSGGTKSKPAATAKPSGKKDSSDAPEITIDKLALSPNLYHDGEYWISVDYDFYANNLAGQTIAIGAILVDEYGQHVLPKYDTPPEYSRNDVISRWSQVQTTEYGLDEFRGYLRFPNSVVSRYSGQHRYCFELLVFTKKKDQFVSEVARTEWFYISPGDQYTSEKPKVYSRPKILGIFNPTYALELDEGEKSMCVEFDIAFEHGDKLNSFTDIECALIDAVTGDRIRLSRVQVYDHELFLPYQQLSKKLHINLDDVYASQFSHDVFLRFNAVGSGVGTYKVETPLFNIYNLYTELEEVQRGYKSSGSSNESWGSKLLKAGAIIGGVILGGVVADEISDYWSSRSSSSSSSSWASSSSSSSSTSSSSSSYKSSSTSSGSSTGSSFSRSASSSGSSSSRPSSSGSSSTYSSAEMFASREGERQRLIDDWYSTPVTIEVQFEYHIVDRSENRDEWDLRDEEIHVTRKEAENLIKSGEDAIVERMGSYARDKVRNVSFKIPYRLYDYPDFFYTESEQYLQKWYEEYFTIEVYFNFHSVDSSENRDTWEPRSYDIRVTRREAMALIESGEAAIVGATTYPRRLIRNVKYDTPYGLFDRP